MAKKKTTGPGTPPASAAGAAAPKKRSASRKSATANAMDGSPVAEGSSTTSEEIQLATRAGSPARASHPSYEEIAQAAYQRYLRRGGTDGQDFDDWLSAERELLDRHAR